VTIGEVVTAMPAFVVGPTSVPRAPPEISKRAVVVAVARRGGPHLLEATFVPASLFYCCLVWGGLTLAYLTLLGWRRSSDGWSAGGRFQPFWCSAWSASP
jgi:hypothetical protein